MKLTIQILIALATVITSVAQELPPVQNFSPSDYAAGNQNWMISQDSKGYLYVANNQGLLSHDGARWTLNETPNGSIIRSVHVVNDTVYSGFYMDYGYWTRSKTGDLDYTSLTNDDSLQMEEDEQVWNILSQDSYVLFQTLSSIYSYDRETGKSKRIVSAKNLLKMFKVSNTFYYQIDEDGLYIIKNGGGVKILDHPKFKTHRLISMFERDGVTSFLFEDAVMLSIENNNYTTKQLLPARDYKLYSALILEDGLLLLGTISHGLFVLDANGATQFQLNRSNSLLNNTCLSLFEDSRQNVWIGLDNGLSLVDLDSQFQIFKDQKGLLGTVYTSQLHDGKLYLGTNQGLFVKNIETGDEFQLVDNTSGQVWAIKEIGGQLFCTHDSGLYRIAGDQSKLIYDRVGVWEIIEVPQNPNLYLMGTYDGFTLYNTVKNLFIEIDGFDISSRDFALKENTVFVNHEYKGVYALEIDFEAGKLLSEHEIEGIQKDIASDIINYKGDILYSNSEGIQRWDENKRSFTIDQYLSSLLAADDYTSGRLHNLDDEDLWIFNRSSIKRIRPKLLDGTFQVDNFPLSQAVRKEMTGFESLTKLTPGGYLIGSSTGYIVLNDIFKTNTEHRVYIDKIITKVDSLERTFFYDGEEILLPYRSNSITVQLATPVYNPLDKPRFQYKISGIQEEWSDWSYSPDIVLQNLSWGSYLLEMRSRIDNSLSTNLATLTIEIRKPWYFSAVAIISYIIILLLLTAAINLFYNRYYRRQKSIALSKQQRDLELVNLSNQNEVVKLRNEKLQDEIKYRNKELAISTMAMIKKNEALGEINTAVKKMTQNVEVKQLLKLLNKNMSNKQEWVTFEEAFNNADKDFFKKIKERHPKLTTGDLRLCTYLRLNLSSKEIAPLLNISPRSVEIKRYRLRKKMELDKEISLTDYIIEM
ncbi:MAG: LuxR family transcriptional regulator [Nonlabens sp.]